LGLSFSCIMYFIGCLENRVNDIHIPMTKKMEGEVEYMCNLSDGVEQRLIEKGKIVVVKNMLKENEPIEKICRIAECDEEFVERVKKEM